MEILETRKYATLRFIVIGLLMTIDLFLVYLLTTMIKKGTLESADIYDMLLVIFIFISIPSFLILTFKKVNFTTTTIDIRYLGLFRTTRQIDGLKMYLTNGEKELRILTPADKYIVSIYEENVSNFDQLKKHLANRLLADQPAKSRLNLLYICWPIVGLILFILTRLD